MRILLAGSAAALLGAGMATAQVQEAPAPTAQPGATQPDETSQPAAQSGSAAASAQTSSSVTQATESDLAAGAAVNDPSGAPIGTIESVNESGVVLALGETRVQIPRTSIGKNDRGLVIASTRAELEAAAREAAQRPS